MEASPRPSWIHIWSITLFGIVSASDRYVIHTDPVSFDKALEECTSGGFLTTLSTKREEADILDRVAAELPADMETKFSFWVGLRKARNECIVPHLTLKGFKWTADGSEGSEEWRWNAEPQETCTGIRCVLMSGEMGPSGRRWGLTPSTCRAAHPFICKQPGAGQTQHAGGGEEAHATPEPGPPPDVEVTDVKVTDVEVTDVEVTDVEVTDVEVTPEQPPQHRPTPEPALDRPEPEAAPDRPEPGPAPDRPKPGPATDREPCSYPDIPGARSFTRDNDDPKRMMVECWSGALHWLTCSGTTPSWHVNDTAVDRAGVCQKCDVGYEKDASGTCVDIDECRDAACRHDCMNTEGSYKCICYDEHHNYHPEGSAACAKGGQLPVNLTYELDLHDRGPSLASPSESSPTDDDSGGEVTIHDGSESGILMPVLIAVLALVVLVALVAVVVKCCLMRRSKKRAMKKAEKMAMKNKDAAGKDSMETANEKEAM